MLLMTPAMALPASFTTSPMISDRSSWGNDGAIRVMIPRTGSRQTRRKQRFQSMAASSAMVPASARRTWMVEPRGPVCMVAGASMAGVPAGNGHPPSYAFHLIAEGAAVR